MKTWIAERCSRARVTVLVQANSKKEAQAKLDDGKGEAVHTEHYDIGRAVIIRQDNHRP